MAVAPEVNLKFTSGEEFSQSYHFNIIYNKNSPTSSGSEMNCRFDHKYPHKYLKEYVNKKEKHLFWYADCIIIKREHIVRETIIEIIHI